MKVMIFNILIMTSLIMNTFANGPIDFIDYLERNVMSEGQMLEALEYQEEYTLEDQKIILSKMKNSLIILEKALENPERYKNMNKVELRPTIISYILGLKTIHYLYRAQQFSHYANHGDLTSKRALRSLEPKKMGKLGRVVQKISTLIKPIEETEDLKRVFWRKGMIAGSITLVGLLVTTHTMKVEDNTLVELVISDDDLKILGQMIKEYKFIIAEYQEFIDESISDLEFTDI